MNLGLAYHSLGQYREAIAEFEKARQSEAQLLAPHLFLGFDYLKLGLNEKAAAALRRALKMDPENHEALRALAAAELAQGHYAVAANQFRDEFRGAPNKEEAWFDLGHGYLEMMQRLVVALTSDHRASAWAHRFSADMWGERGAWTDAAREYRVAIALDPRQIGLHTRLGVSCLAQSKTDDAEAEFQKELALNPHDPRALLGMAEAQLLKGAAGPALATTSKILDADPVVLAELANRPEMNLSPKVAERLANELAQTLGPPEGASQPPGRAPASPATAASSHFLRLIVYKAAGEAAEAEAAQDAFLRQFRQWQAAQAQKPAAGASREACQQHQTPACVKWLESRNPRTIGDNLLLGQTLLTMDDDEQASEAFALALKQEPTSPAAIYWLLRTYQRLADGCFEQLAASFPDGWRVHQMKAEVYASSEQYLRATEEYQLALEKQPGNAGLHAALGAMYLKKKSLPEARAEVEKALELDPTAADTLCLAGQLYVAERKPADAIPYLQNALRRDPSLVEAHAALGNAYLRCGKAQLAVEELKKSLELDRYGDLHFLLSQAYRQLGEAALAQQALARSQELRKDSAAADQAKLAGTRQDDDKGP